MEESMKVSKLRTVAKHAVICAFVGVLSVQGAIILKQQAAINSLIWIANANAEFDRVTITKMWDLHRRVVALESEDQRIMSHVRWFVMRRSGTDELRRMEQAVERLEVE
jgi:hypothetical protein